MSYFDSMLTVLEYLADPLYWGTILTMLAMTVVIGILPGVSSVLVMAILIPFVVIRVTDPIIGLVMLATLTGVSNTFDSIPAVIMGMPGGGTQVTFIEGHQLARKGLAAYVMGATYAVSAIGGIVGALVLLVVIPVIRPFILSFSFSEIAMTALFGLAMVSIMSRGAMLKGLGSGMIGLLLGSVGLDGATGIQRYTFGIYEMDLGLPLIATILGIFAMPEMLDLTLSRNPVAPAGDVSNREVWRGFRVGMGKWRMAIRHSVYGVLLGAIPGVGSSVITWLSYGLGIVLSKDRSEFGKGSLDGVLFAESAENAKEGGQAIPTLALGVPGGTGWVLVLVAMTVYGITPGPDMLSRHADVVSLLVVTLALGNFLLTMLGLVITGTLVKITRVPYPIIAATIIPIAMLSAYLDMLEWIAIPIVIIFTAFGFLLKWYGWPRPPLVLGFILGPIVEANMFSAVSIYGVAGVLTRPITVVLFIAIIVIMVLLHILMSRSDKQAAEIAVIAQEEGVEGVEELVGANEPGSVAVKTRQRIPLYWRREHIFPLALFIISTITLVQARGFSGRAGFFPTWASIGLMVLTGAQLVVQARQANQHRGDIMDLGMLSAGKSDFVRSAVVLGTLFVGSYLFGVTILGLRYTGYLFAFLLPVLFMEGSKRWLYGAGAAVGVFLFSWIIADMLLTILWPDPVITLGFLNFLKQR